MKKLFLALLLLFAATQTPAQFLGGGGIAISPPNVGTTLPATCSVGRLFFKTDATPGSNIYECAATNTWTQQASGGASSLTIGSSTITSGTNGRILFDSSGVVGELANLLIGTMPLMAPNTVMANVTSGTAVPTAYAMTGCLTAVIWATNTGFGCNTALPASALQGVMVGGTAVTPDVGWINFLVATGTAGIACVRNSGLNSADCTFTFPAGGGTVTTTGSPASGNLTKFSGSGSITNGDLSGDVSTSGTLVTTIGAGKVTEAMQVTADNTTQNVSSTKHGYAPKSPADATQFLNGAATPAYAAVKDSDLSTTDITTNNATTSKHGFVPKLPNDATKYYDGTGNYTVPAGGGGGSGGGTSGWSATTISLAVNATQYTSFAGGVTDSATEANVQSAIGAAATISGLYVNLDAALGGSATLTVTLRNGGVDTALTCVTASGGASCNDTTHSVNVAKGDLLSFKIVAGGTVTAATPSLKINYATGTSGVGITSLATTGPIGGGPITTTGTITCTTCATTTNGGAITGTSPIAVSAGGAISITGAANQVLAGSTGAPTATPTVTSIGVVGATSGSAVIQAGAAVMGATVAQIPASGDTLNFNTSAYCILSADQTGANSTTAQPFFAFATASGGCGTNGQFNATGATTYEYEMEATLVRSAGTNTHGTTVLFAGSATFTSAMLIIGCSDQTSGASGTASVMQLTALATGAAVCPSSGNATENARIWAKGMIRVNAAGTIIPQFIYTTGAPGGTPTIGMNSYFKFTPVGDNTVKVIGNIN